MYHVFCLSGIGCDFSVFLLKRCFAIPRPPASLGVHLGSLCSSWGTRWLPLGSPLAAAGCPWPPLAALPPGSPWPRLAAPGCPWSPLAAPGRPWVPLARPWPSLAAPGRPRPCSHLAALGRPWPSLAAVIALTEYMCA